MLKKYAPLMMTKQNHFFQTLPPKMDASTGVASGVDVMRLLVIGARRQSTPNHGGMRAEHLAPAAGAAIACAFLALVLMLQRQMARQEQVLREILRMHRELLDSQLESNRLLKRRQSLTGSPAGSAAGIDSDTDPWYGDTGATLAPARTGSRVPSAPRLESASQWILARCPSGYSHSVVSQQQHQLPQSAKPPAHPPRSSTSSGISFCKPADRPPAADSLSQHGSFSVQTGVGVHVSRVGGCLAGTRPVCSSLQLSFMGLIRCLTIHCPL